MRAITAAILGALFAGPLSAQTAAQQSFAKRLAQDEPAIKDARWMNASNLYVGVMDNGTRRDGYATYVCNDAKPAGAKMVKVIDIAKLKQTGKFVELGQAWCK